MLNKNALRYMKNVMTQLLVVFFPPRRLKELLPLLVKEYLVESYILVIVYIIVDTQ